MWCSGGLQPELWWLYLQEMPWATPHAEGKGHVILNLTQNHAIPMSLAGPTGSGEHSSSKNGQTCSNFGSSRFVGWVLVAIDIFRLHEGEQTWMWGDWQKKRITNQSFFCKIACLIDVFHPFQLWTLNIPEPCSLSGQRPVQEALQRVFDWLSQFCWKCGSHVSEDCSQQNYWLLYSWHSGWFPENINDDGGGMHRPWTWHSSLF